MPDTGIGAGKDMQQESPDKFTSGKSNIFFYITVFSVTIGKGNHVTSNTLYAVIGDGNPKGIAAQVVDYPLWSGKCLGRVYYPVFSIQIIYDLNLSMKIPVK